MDQPPSRDWIEQKFVSVINNPVFDTTSDVHVQEFYLAFRQRYALNPVDMATLISRNWQNRVGREPARYPTGTTPMVPNSPRVSPSAGQVSGTFVNPTYSSGQSASPQKIEEEEFYDNSLIHAAIEDPTETFQTGKRRFMEEYFAGMRCSGKNPPFMNLILKDGRPLKFDRAMDNPERGIAVGQFNGTNYVLKYVAERGDDEGDDDVEHIIPEQVINAHQKAHILANNGTSNFFSDIYAIIRCNVDAERNVPGKMLSQLMFFYEAGNLLFSDWLKTASPEQFHRAIQQWILSFIIQTLLGFRHGDPHEANVVVSYLQPGGQWRYNIGGLVAYLPNTGFVLKMIDYDESNPNADVLPGLQTLDVILGQTYPVLISTRQQMGIGILPETMTFMNDIAPIGKAKSTTEALEVIRRMAILADLFVPTNAPLLGSFNVSVPIVTGDPKIARQAMGINDQPPAMFNPNLLSAPFGSLSLPQTGTGMPPVPFGGPFGSPATPPRSSTGTPFKFF